ncbi:hypothetical protein SSS_10529, partial [Sarcoptes scabiei]
VTYQCANLVRNVLVRMMRQTLLLLIFVSSLAYSFAYIKVYQKRANDCGLSQQSSHGLRHKCLGEHQFYSKLCDATCRHPHKKRRYVRTHKNGKGKCVRLKHCKHCPQHERKVLCRGHCQPTCKKPHPKCSLKCKKGCRCKLGFVRQRHNGPCIKWKYCKNKKSFFKLFFKK